jgi:hypothetical protein
MPESKLHIYVRLADVCPAVQQQELDITPEEVVN